MVELFLLGGGQKQLARWAKRTSELWDALFEGTVRESEHSEVARHLMFATLRGMADEINPRGIKTKKAIDQECDALAEAITFLLTRG